MAKKRKTRKDKILSDLHRKTSYKVDVTPFASQPAKSISEVKTEIPKAQKSNIDKYPYLINDISRTGVVTASIIAFQILLFIILKFHVLKLPGISY
ncbi:MAG: hypothetical protein AAB521_03740 [Patescibacteria group bacterium]